jgi:hypothetical protein
VRIDLDDLRRHYAGLAEEELAAINADELTEAARAIYQAEVRRRDLRLPQEAGSPGEAHFGASRDETEEIGDPVGEFDIDVEPPPDWLEDAACACSFATRPGNTDLPGAQQARSFCAARAYPAASP